MKDTEIRDGKPIERDEGHEAEEAEQEDKNALTDAEKSLLREELKKVSPADRKKESPMNKFKWKKGPMKQSEKKVDMMPILYLNLKGQIEGPFLTKVYGGCFMVVRDHVYRYNPKKLWAIGKHRVAIVKQWDREMLGMDDFEAVVSQGSERTPLNDPVLIKAIIQARLAEKKPMDSKWIWIILGIVALIAVAMMFMKKSPTPTTEG